MDFIYSDKMLFLRRHGSLFCRNHFWAMDYFSKCCLIPTPRYVTIHEVATHYKVLNCKQKIGFKQLPPIL